MQFEVSVLPQWTPFILQLIATLVIFLVLRHFLFQPVSEILEKRKEKIAGDLSKAEEEKKDAATLKREYEIKIDEAKQEGQEIIQAARKRGEELRKEIIEEARKESESLIQKANTEIERQRKKAMEDFKTDVVSISMMAASKVIEKNLDEDVHKKMINEFIDEVGESTWQS